MGKLATEQKKRIAELDSQSSSARDISCLTGIPVKTVMAAVADIRKRQRIETYKALRRD